jgi:sulfatase modifying factor 1
VTQEAWWNLLGTQPSASETCWTDCPVESISWYEALAYANARSRAEGLTECYELEGCTDAPPGSATFTCESAARVPGRCSGYRIPTEAEWEHAARAGAWTERYGPLHEIAWSQESGILEPQRVGQLPPNAWGLHDVLGNVWEWTWDTVSNTGAPLPADNPESAGYPYRVLRGGSYTSPRESVRAAMRFVVLSEYRAPNVGLRLVRSARVRGAE